MKTTTEQLFDVVIYEIATSTIDAIVGISMRKEGRHESAETRCDTVAPRLNEDFNVAVVPAGKYTKGDVVSKADLKNG